MTGGPNGRMRGCRRRRNALVVSAARRLLGLMCLEKRGGDKEREIREMTNVVFRPTILSLGLGFSSPPFAFFSRLSNENGTLRNFARRRKKEPYMTFCLPLLIICKTICDEASYRDERGRHWAIHRLSVT